MTRRRAVVILLAAAALGLGIGGPLWVGGQLSAPAHRAAPFPPAVLRAENVEIVSESGSRLSAWYSSPEVPSAAVAILHCVRCSRADMLSRAEMLFLAGFAVLVPDLQAHGESPGEAITFGYLESKDAAASVRYLRRRHPELSVGGLGVSLGGAALVLGADSVGADALVLESVYPTIEEAVTNRIAIRLGPLSRIAAPLLLVQLRPRLGMSPAELRPIDHIGDLECPLLIVSGTHDRHTTQAETLRLFEAASEPKRLWLVEGAAHQDLLAYDSESYYNIVVGFLLQNLVEKSAQPTAEPDPIGA